MTFLSMGQRSKPTQTTSEIDQSLFSALLDMVSCGGKMNACHPTTYQLPTSKLPSRRFDERDLLDDIFEGRVLSCGGRGQNNKTPVHRVFSNDRDLLDHIFEGRVLPCGPHMTANDEQVKRTFSDRRDLLDHIFEGRVFSGGMQSVGANNNQEQVQRLFSDKRDLLDDVFEGRVLPCGPQAHDNPDQVKRVFSSEPDLLDHIFEGGVLPCQASGHEQHKVKRVFSDERDILDDAFEGRIFACGAPGNRSNGSIEPEKEESNDQRDLVDLVLEGNFFSGAVPASSTNDNTDLGKMAFDDKRSIMDKIGGPLVFNDDLASGLPSTTEKEATERDSQSRHDERVVDMPEERGCFRMMLEDFLCTCQASTDAHDHSTSSGAQVIPQSIPEERDLLDDVFEGRLCAGGMNHKVIEPTKNDVPDKDALDHIFENVERNVCGVGTRTASASHQLPEVTVKHNHSLIDDASTVGSHSHVSRKGLWIFSSNERQPMELQNSQRGELQKKNIIQSFLSSNERQ